MNITFPGESPEYRAARNRLLDEEISLRRATEAVAAARRNLPPGGLIPAPPTGTSRSTTTAAIRAILKPI